VSVRQEEYIVTNRARGAMLSPAATAVQIRDFPPLISDEPPARGGENRGPSPLELVLAALCACTNVSTTRMAKKIRFRYDYLETYAEGVLDTRGRKGLADVPVHYKAVNLTVRIRTAESDQRLDRLIELVGRYCPVDSLIRAAVADYQVRWERLAQEAPPA
jgi:uncharacterized OsmC-like protein